MVAIGYKTLAIICFILAIGMADGKKKKIKSNKTTVTPATATKQYKTTTDDLVNTTISYNNNTAPVVNPTLPPLTKCKTVFCSDKCDNVPGVGAVCSCSNDKMYLSSDGRTCKPKSCDEKDSKRGYICGALAKCVLQWTFMKGNFGGSNLPKCECIANFRTQLVLDPKTNSCKRDPLFKTCDWPKDSGCQQECKEVGVRRGLGSRPKCSCRAGYTLNGNGKDCKLTNPCAVGNKNGGCETKCDFDQTMKVQCSCHSNTHTLAADGKSCVLKSCDNLNSGCTQGCTQIDKRNYFCSCKQGWRMNSDMKTCYNYDECSGFHGCDQQCLPDGDYFKCGCDEGYYLATNGFSCRANLKCINHGCTQHCNPTTGNCYCDDKHQLDVDGKTCIDIDECATDKDDCTEKCTNTNGGYVCDCNDPKATLSNDLKTCELSTCRELENIKYGKTTCTHSHGDKGTMKIGDFCEFSCPSGMKLIGTTRVHCYDTGYDVEPPHCQDVNECTDPLRCNDGERCANRINGFDCLCKAGFIRDEDRTCVDNMGPQVIGCPKDAVIQLPDDSDYVKFTWTKPTTFDPTDVKVYCSRCPSSEEKILNVGDFTITYVYSDEANNRAICSFKVKVVDVTPPVFSGCPNGTVFTRGPGIYSLAEFANVSATDNAGPPTVVNDKPPQFKNPGLRTVNYIARDASGNHDSCTFYVNITVNECPVLDPPKNGFHGCNDWHIGSFCEPKCNPNFAFLSVNASDRFHCGVDGTWQPTKPMPDCYSIAQPKTASIKYVSRYKGKCPNDTPAAKNQFILIAKTAFNESTAIFCFAGDACKLIGDPEISCKDGYFTITMTTNEDYSIVPGHDEMLIEFKKKIRAAVAVNSNLMMLFLPPAKFFKPLVDQNGLPITPVFNLECPTGATRVDNKCVKCPAGMKC